MNEIDRVVESLKYYLETNDENGVVYFPKFAIERAIYRLEKSDQKKNEPLTLDEMREMFRTPVYDGLGYEWYIIDEVDDSGVTMTDLTRFDIDDGFDAVSNRFYRHPPKTDMPWYGVETDHEIITNADRIRSMDDEELAKFLWGFNREKIAFNGYGLFRNKLEEWLKQPAEEE